MLRGYYWEGKPHESELEIVAMYLAQTPSTDIGREQAASHGIPIKATVSDAIVPGIQGVALESGNDNGLVVVRSTNQAFKFPILRLC
jgi:hypothetical protein